MAGESTEVVEMLHKMAADMSSFTARQDQLEAFQARTCKNQEETVNDLREVLNEVIHGSRRLERGKDIDTRGGELYSPSDLPLSIGEMATPNSMGGTCSVSSSISLPSSTPTSNLVPPARNIAVGVNWTSLGPSNQIPLNPSLQNPNTVIRTQPVMMSTQGPSGPYSPQPRNQPAPHHLPSESQRNYYT
ncbi:hypothetical protein A4A49_56398, partial [Nicotiana attenuata]